MSETTHTYTDPPKDLTPPSERLVDPAIAAIEETTALVVLEANGITITDADGYGYAGAFLTETLKPARAEIEATFGPIVKAAHLAHKEALTQRQRHEGPLIKAEHIVKRAMGTYVTEQRRIAAVAETERLRVAREEAEAAALAEAERLEAAGHTEAAEEKITAPVVPVVSAPPPEEPKAAGVSARMVSKYRIIDPSAIDRDYLMPDEKKIGQVVRAMGADAERLIGGIEVYEEPVIAASAR
jgi:hypothetical protein